MPLSLTTSKPPTILFLLVDEAINERPFTIAYHLMKEAFQLPDDDYYILDTDDQIRLCVNNLVMPLETEPLDFDANLPQMPFSKRTLTERLRSALPDELKAGIVRKLILSSINANLAWHFIVIVHSLNEIVEFVEDEPAFAGSLARRPSAMRAIYIRHDPPGVVPWSKGQFFPVTLNVEHCDVDISLETLTKTIYDLVGV